MSPVSKVHLTAFSRCGVCPTGLFVAAGRDRLETVRRVRSSLAGRITGFRRRKGVCRTGQLCRHIACSVRVVHRLKRYSNVRGCSHCFSKHGTNAHPCYLLSFFPSSFLVMVSRDRIDMPRVHTVCNNSQTEGAGLIRCNFQVRSTFSGHPLGFRRFGRLTGRIVCIDTAPTSCRLIRDRNVVIRRIVHPAKLLSPMVRMHPDLGRVSSLVRRVRRHVRGRRHMLIAALAGHVTRRLARCLLHGSVHYGCVRDSISALRHIGVVSRLHRNICSMLINIGLLHRNLSLPRISLITVLSTSGRKFLHSRHSLARATKHTTHGVGKGMVVCTSHVASDVGGAVSRAGHHHRGRLTCGRRRKVAPGRVRHTQGTTLLNGGDGRITKAARNPGTCVRPSSSAATTSPVIRCVAGPRVRGAVRHAQGLVRRTTGGLRFVRTTRCESRLLGLRSVVGRE